MPQNTAPTVLYVDDNDVAGRQFERQMEKHGFPVVVANSALRALRLCESCRFDVVVSDLRMPQMDGLSFLRELRAQRVESGFILISDVPGVDLAREHGVSAFIARPWKPEEMVQAIRAAAAEHAADLPAKSSIAVLLVDANPSDAELIKHYLRTSPSESYSVQTAQTLSGAIESLRENPTKLVIADVNLPDANGREVVERLCREARDAALIIAADCDNEGLAVESIALGAQEFFVKHEADENSFCRAARFALERKQSERHLAHLAYIDELTGLANRKRMRSELLETLSRAARKSEPFGLLYVDLDGFKPVNDQLGHDVGDELLRQAAVRMQRALRDYDTIARIGGDEFSILLDSPCHPTQVKAVAARVMKRLRQPYHISGRAISVGASLGVALYPQEGDTPEKLLRAADVAMYDAKRAGGDRVSTSNSKRSTEDLVSRLRRATGDGEFELVYQPQLELAKRSVVALEALLRWIPKSGAQVSPAAFVPVLEQEGLIGEVGEWVIRQAVQQLHDWDAEGFDTLEIAVNVSSRQFESGGLARTVEEVLNEHSIAPNRLQLEITESTLMRNTRATNDSLESLKKLGVKLAIDDFGTGYSSLAYLHRFRVDMLKIDGAFVSELGVTSEGDAITEAIIGLGQQLGLTVVAEGVETPEQAKFVSERNCDRVQGYYFSEAMRPAKVATYVTSDRPPNEATA